MNDIEGIRRFEIPIDDQHHTVKLSGNPIRVDVTEDRTTMLVWAATDTSDPERERTFRVYPFHTSLFGRMEVLPGDAVLRGETGFRPDRWRWSLYELVRGR